MEKKKSQWTSKKTVLRAIGIAAAAGMVVFVALEMFKVQLIPDERHNQIVNVLVTRALAAVFFLTVLIESGDDVTCRRPAKEYLKSLLLVIPALLVAVNNMPIISLALKRCNVTDSFGWVLLFALECLAVGAFEELAFRGILFPYFLKKCKTRLHIFFCIAATSCVFGLYHLFNLLQGAGIGGVMRQVGYSALIGAMCAVCMLITGDIAVPIVLHGVYNFCGLLVETVGDNGQMWDTPTIIITAALGTAVFLFYLVVFLKKKSFRLYERLRPAETEPEKKRIEDDSPEER